MQDLLAANDYIPANDYKLQVPYLIIQSLFGTASATLSSALTIIRSRINQYRIFFGLTGAIDLSGIVQRATVVGDIISIVMILVQEDKIQRMDHAFQEMKKIFQNDQLSYLKQNLSYLKQQSESIQLELVKLKKELVENPNPAQESDKFQKMMMNIIKVRIMSIFVLFDTIEITYKSMILCLEDLKKRSDESEKHLRGIRILGKFIGILQIFGAFAAGVALTGPIGWMAGVSCGYSLVSGIYLITKVNKMQKLENQLTQGIQLLTTVQNKFQQYNEKFLKIKNKILEVNVLIEEGQLQPLIEHLNQNSMNILQEIKDFNILMKNVVHFYYNDSCYTCLKDFKETQEIHIFPCNHVICNNCLLEQLKRFPGKCPTGCNSNGETRTGLFYKLCSTEI